MDQNQAEANDLQKAIDDITNTTNIDPVFSDPVAAPSSIPEGDTGELGEAIGPFSTQNVGVVTPGPEPIAPLESADIPALNNLTVPETPPQPEPTAPTPVPTPELEPTTVENSNTSEIKKAALRDLAPLLDKVTMDAPDKFKIYRDIFEDLKDQSILEPAYQAAREIPDETERAEALLYLVQSIDKM